MFVSIAPATRDLWIVNISRDLWICGFVHADTNVTVLIQGRGMVTRILVQVNLLVYSPDDDDVALDLPRNDMIAKHPLMF